MNYCQKNNNFDLDPNITPDTSYTLRPNFTSIDFNLCLFFWMMSVVLCGYVCCAFRRRRTFNLRRHDNYAYRLLPR